MVENTIQNGVKSADRIAGRVCLYDEVSHSTEITVHEPVVTTIYGQASK